MNVNRALLPSKKIFVVLPMVAAASAAAQAPPPKVVLERIVDGRENRVCDIAKASVAAEGVRRSAWVVRGLLRSDVVLTLETVGPGPATTHSIAVGAGPPLRFTSESAGGRVTASSPTSAFRYFEFDLSRKTVRCNLSRLAEETDHELLHAAQEYADEGLEEDGLAPEEAPILTLFAVEKRPAPASRPVRKRLILTDGGPESDDLAAAARGALTR